ncbi:MAG: gliding motility-associated C-terminal domain-containing protein [Bacteroidota bacterium]
MRIKEYFIFTAFLLTALFSNAQPFQCSGDFYLSQTEEGQNTQFYRVVIDPITENVVFLPLPRTVPASLNAIGYRSTDNYIYAINPTTADLWRINNDGSGELLKQLTEIQGRDYIAGDITADGRFYVISGLENLQNNVNIILVDLEDPDFGTTEVLMPNTTRFADMSFDPISGVLYAFDSNSDRVCTVDINTGDVTFIGTNAGFNDLVMGATFFNSFGVMFGYGGLITDQSQLRFFRFNKEQGTGQVVTTGPVASFNDGCSCPYIIEINKTVTPEVVVPCVEVEYVFQIANVSGGTRRDVIFEDVLPAGFEITEIVRNPYVGNVVSGIGTDFLRIENMILPPGIDSIVIKVLTPENVTGTFGNQASMQNLPPAFGGDIVSDNPNTVIDDDSTFLTIEPLFLDLENQGNTICEGDSLLLNASVHGVTYLWDDGSTDSTRLVTEEGTYSVAISSGCETVFDTITIDVIENIDVDLGPDLEITLGDSIEIIPSINFSGNVLYQWEEEAPNVSISCLDCPTVTARPFGDAIYRLAVETPQGCMDEDELRVTVDVTKRVFGPNAFSPNGDNINDLFFLQSDRNDPILKIQIFDRWGGLMYEARDILLNDQAPGWDGRVGNKLANIGVYVWVAEVAFLDGNQILSGDLTLIR